MIATFRHTYAASVVSRRVGVEGFFVSDGADGYHAAMY